MGLFEILFIALFILFPILEKVLKSGKQNGEAPDSGTPGPAVPGREPRSPERMEPRAGESGPRPSEQEPVKAAEMVPDDLWAILTGEQRPREGVEEEWAAAEEEWTAAEEEWTAAEPAAAEAPAPRSLEHDVPEAYSLEDFERVPLERPIPTAEARHRRFHELIDRPQPRRPARRSRIGRALRRPESVREAVVLSEVLGQPKGLE